MLRPVWNGYVAFTMDKIGELLHFLIMCLGRTYEDQPSTELPVIPAGNRRIGRLLAAQRNPFAAQPVAQLGDIASSPRRTVSGLRAAEGRGRAAGRGKTSTVCRSLRHLHRTG